ncbi:MAG TPA: hypothetical protein VGK38_11505 [Prolixibacteraceae bacterium]
MSPRYLIEQKDYRNQSVTGFSFTIGANQLPVPAVHIPRKSVALTVDQKIKETLSQCLPPGSDLRYTDLKNKYIELTSCSETSAENHITKALKHEYLTKNEFGYYSFKPHKAP